MNEDVTLLETLGYVVNVDEDSGTASVQGFGVATMVQLDDDAAWASLASVDGHLERVRQMVGDVTGVPAAEVPPVEP
jgi:hypothetical protein